MAEITPFARPLRLSEGEHLVELKNPYFKQETRMIRVREGDTQIVRVALVPNKDEPPTPASPRS